VSNDRLDANSATFKQFYFVNTVFMRSPDRYPELAVALHQAFLGNRLGTNKARPNLQLMRESKTWSPEVQQVVIHTADALQQVLVDYSFFCRLYFKGAEEKAKFEHKHLNGWHLVDWLTCKARTLAQKVAANIAKKDQFVQDIRNAQDLMYQMAKRGLTLRRMLWPRIFVFRLRLWGSL
jgi:hypothetical protein